MYSATKEQLDKRRFIHRMGPYYLQARSEDKVDDFFAMVFVHYVDRWPIDTSKYINAALQKTDMARMKMASNVFKLNRLLIDLVSQSLCEAIRVWSGRAYGAEKHWQDLFKHGRAVAQVFLIRSLPWLPVSSVLYVARALRPVVHGRPAHSA